MIIQLSIQQHLNNLFTILKIWIKLNLIKLGTRLLQDWYEESDDDEDVEDIWRVASQGKLLEEEKEKVKEKLNDNMREFVYQIRNKIFV